MLIKRITNLLKSLKIEKKFANIYMEKRVRRKENGKKSTNKTKTKSTFHKLLHIILLPNRIYQEVQNTNIIIQ